MSEAAWYSVRSGLWMADWSGLSSRTVRLLMKERDPDGHPLNRTRQLTGWRGVWLPLLRLPDCVLVQPERSTPVRLRTAPSKTPNFTYLLIIRSYLLSSIYTIIRLLCHRNRRNLRKNAEAGLLPGTGNERGNRGLSIRGSVSRPLRTSGSRTCRT